MKLGELNTNDKVFIKFKLENNEFQFESEVLNSNESFVKLECIHVKNKPLNFENSNILVDILFCRKEGNPILWKKCKLTNSNIPKRCYILPSELSGNAINRRQDYRLDLQKLVVGQVKENTPSIKVILNDISASGMSVIVPVSSEPKIDDFISVFLNDEKFNRNFRIHAKIIRIQEMDNKRVICGCIFRKQSKEVEKYIYDVQRDRLTRKRI